MGSFCSSLVVDPCSATIARQVSSHLLDDMFLTELSNVFSIISSFGANCCATAILEEWLCNLGKVLLSYFENEIKIPSTSFHGDFHKKTCSNCFVDYEKRSDKGIWGSRFGCMANTNFSILLSENLRGSIYAERELNKGIVTNSTTNCPILIK